MQDQRRHVDRLQIVGMIALGERLNGGEDARDTGLHTLQPERVKDGLRHLRVWPIRAVIRHAQVLEEPRAIGQHAGAHASESLDRQAAGVSGRLHHQWCHGADQNNLRHA